MTPNRRDVTINGAASRPRRFISVVHQIAPLARNSGSAAVPAAVSPASGRWVSVAFIDFAIARERRRPGGRIAGLRPARSRQLEQILGHSGKPIVEPRPSTIRKRVIDHRR